MSTINTNQLLMQLRTAAAQAQGIPQAPAQTMGTAQATSGANFSTMLTQSINKVNEMQQTAGQMREAFEMGAPNVSLPEVMLAGNKASLAFEGMVQVRNKMVEAYQEIMRMQV
ncbi:MAG: flagellar hook-basal body complex protein FliE [Thiohalomonadaceae bacterium]